MEKEIFLSGDKVITVRSRDGFPVGIEGIVVASCSDSKNKLHATHASGSQYSVAVEFPLYHEYRHLLHTCTIKKGSRIIMMNGYKFFYFKERDLRSLTGFIHEASSEEEL